MSPEGWQHATNAGAALRTLGRNLRIPLPDMMAEEFLYRLPIPLPDLRAQEFFIQGSQKAGTLRSFLYRVSAISEKRSEFFIHGFPGFAEFLFKRSAN